MPSEGGLLLIPAASWENLQVPLQLQVREHESSPRSKADRAGVLVSSALLLSLLHIFLLPLTFSGLKIRNTFLLHTKLLPHTHFFFFLL